jgi:hypothetical protein
MKNNIKYFIEINPKTPMIWRITDHIKIEFRDRSNPYQKTWEKSFYRHEWELTTSDTLKVSEITEEELALIF